MLKDFELFSSQYIELSDSGNKLSGTGGGKSPDISKTCFLDNSGRENTFSAFLTMLGFLPPRSGLLPPPIPI